MKIVAPAVKVDPAPRYARMLASLGNESRLRIVRLLLSAHPQGLIVGDIQSELGIAASTLSHHLERLKREGVVSVRREGTFLWCAADAAGLEELLGFLFSECCSRSRVVSASAVVQVARNGRKGSQP